MLVQAEEPRSKIIENKPFATPQRHFPHYCCIIWVNLCCCCCAVFMVCCESPFQSASIGRFFLRHLKDFVASPRSVCTSIKSNVLHEVPPKHTNLQLNSYLSTSKSLQTALLVKRGNWNNSLAHLVFTHRILWIYKNFSHTFPQPFMVFSNNPRKLQRYANWNTTFLHDNYQIFSSSLSAQMKHRFNFSLT